MSKGVEDEVHDGSDEADSLGFVHPDREGDIFDGVIGALDSTRDDGH